LNFPAIFTHRQIVAFFSSQGRQKAYLVLKFDNLESKNELTYFLAHRLQSVKAEQNRDYKN